MDYKAEQEMELEALEAILMEDFSELVDDVPEGWSSSSPCYRILINPTEEAANEDYKLELVFSHTPAYPDEAPLYKARSIRGLGSADLADVSVRLAEQVEANIGMAMVYALVAAAQDWLREKAAAGQEVPVDPAAARKAADDAEERRLAEIRSHGTMVTPQTFAEWKQRFDAETALQRSRLQGSEAAGDKKDKGPTGKHFFRQMEATAAEKGIEEQEEGDIDDEEEYEENGEMANGDLDGDEDEDGDDDFLDEYLADKAGE
ncbi:hypothetical protein CVIRNUC_008653 [Coccomyxa viridis]|uniref:RWD domain-containing protein n=1 Tax=Coccomyxa viridis TaxID=1274662 RepID=A0AAV1IDL5_9CHLO|nr:hypothetical protein CVIRNUC_008653 [Coccomyxa viridis]